MMEDLFNPYVKEILHGTMKIIKKLLEEIPPESTEVNAITYMNLLQCLTFEVHSNTRNNPVNKELLNLDQSVFHTLLENIFVQLN